jgi:hypothetical protein
MSAATIPPSSTADILLPKPKAKSRRGTLTDVTTASVAVDTHIRPSKEIIYETPKREPVLEDDDVNDDYDDEFLEDTRASGREIVGPLAGPYLMHYVYKRRFNDTQYVIRKNGDIFKIGDYAVLVGEDGDITIKEKEFRGPNGCGNY